MAAGVAGVAADLGAAVAAKGHGDLRALHPPEARALGAADRATLKVSLAPGGGVVGARGHAVDMDPGDAEQVSG